MAQFETIVRPAVFPNIRPAAPRALPPAPDPGEGVVIQGNPAQAFELSYSFSFSSTSASSGEDKRRFDRARVYKKDDDGTIDEDSFVDIEVANKIWRAGASRRSPSTGPNMAGGASQEKWTEQFRRVSREDNIEIRKIDQIK
jgi:hypothetical protein